MEEIDVLDNIDIIPSCSYYRTPEPIVIRGTGRLTVYDVLLKF